MVATCKEAYLLEGELGDGKEAKDVGATDEEPSLNVDAIWIGFRPFFIV